MTRPAREADDPPFAPTNRREVLWLAPPIPNAAFIEACRLQDLTLIAVQVEDVETHAPNARALLLPVPTPDRQFMKRARVAIATARQHGQLVGLVFQTDARPGDMPPEADAKAYFQVCRRLEREGLSYRGFYYHWDLIARDLASLQVEPGANDALVIEGADSIDQEAHILLRRAFHDLSSIRLDALSGGKSGAGIWQISTVSSDGRPLPLTVVAKISTPEKIAAEKSACLLIERYVPHRLYAPLVKERCLSALNSAVATYQFLSRSEELATRLSTSGPALIGNLFEYTLGGMHGTAVTTSGKIVPEFGPEGLKIFKWTDELEVAADHALGRGARVPRPAELQQILDELPTSTFKSGIVHGDAHLGNLFVPVDTLDVVLIDYGSVRQNAPVVADVACLEVSILFSCCAHAKLGHAALLERMLDAYSYPLTPSKTRALGVVTGSITAATIRALRERARTLDPNHTTYCVAVAAYLIRFAAYAENGTTDIRGIAYELAAQLISNAGVAMHHELGRAHGKVR